MPIFQYNNINKYSKSILAGMFGMLALTTVYVLIMFLATRNFHNIIEQFIVFKYWITALIIGFGIQAGLFWYIRSGLHLSGGATKSTLAASGTSSAIAMVACCAHHLVDFLPLLGLSAASLFLSKYQTYFFLFGVIANAAGIALMIYIIKTKSCPDFFKFLKNKLSKTKL